MNTEQIKQKIVEEIQLMPDYHIDLFGSGAYKRMINPNNWKRSFKKKIGDEFLREFVLDAGEFTFFLDDPECKFQIIATSHDNGNSVLDVQFEMKSDDLAVKPLVF